MDDMLILQAKGDLTAYRVGEILENARAVVKKHDEKGYTDIVLDLKGVDVIDSMGITFVVGLYKTAASMGKKFRVIGLNKEIHRLFRIMKLDRIFAVCA